MTTTTTTTTRQHNSDNNNSNSNNNNNNEHNNNKNIKHNKDNASLRESGVDGKLSVLLQSPIYPPWRRCTSFCFRTEID